MPMKKFTFLSIVAFLFLSNLCYSQLQIPGKFYGINYWMPDTIGTVFYNGFVQTPAIKTKVQNCKPGIIRVGGNGFDTDGNIFYHYYKACSTVVALGGEPLVQIPVKYGNFTFTVAQAKSLVLYLRSQGLKIKYFSVGNEYDLYPFPYNRIDSVSAIVKRFSHSIKTAYTNAKDSTLIVAPSVSWFGAQDNLFVDMLTQLVGTPGGANDITLQNSVITGGTYYFVDIIDWHDYPFNMKTLNAGNYTTTKDNAIAYPAGTAPFRFANNITKMNGWIAVANSFHGRTTAGKPLKFAVTEMHITYKNPPYNPSTDYSDSLKNSIYGIGCASFFAGQFWADMYSQMLKNGGANAVFMTPWSVHELNGNRDSTDFGFLDSTIASGTKERSTYYHTQLLANNFVGKYYAGTSSVPKVKTFASVEGAGYKIMVLNQSGTPYDFRINNNGGTGTTGGYINLNYNLSSDPVLAGNVTTFTYHSPLPDSLAPNSTIVLTFDCHGDFQGRVDYTINDLKNNQPPAVTQIGGNDVNPNMIACGMPGGIGGTINSNTTYSGTTVYVSSDILVTSSAKLSFNNCTVVMAPNVSIKTTPQASIEIINSVMLGCDGKKWAGIEMNGNYHSGLKLLIQNSFIFNAVTPVKSAKLADLKITGSVFANGTTAVDLDRSETFSISDNIFAGYTTGIRTTKTKPGFTSFIKDNQFLELDKGLDFTDDGHNALSILCNDIKYRQDGIISRNTDLMVQGTSSLSAGNNFVKTTSMIPNDYLDHTGTATQYFYGPSQTTAFSFPGVMNIPIVMAAADRVCPILSATNCPLWTIGIEENTTKPLTPNMLVYPNPSQGAFTVSFSNLPKGNWTLSVYDVLGRVISTRKIEANLESTTLQIVSKGLYFVTLHSADNRITQKVIVE